MNSQNSREYHDQETRQTEIEKGYEDSGSDSNPRGLGDVAQSRSEIRDNQIGISREVSQRRNLSGSSFGGQILGGTISQLIAKAEDQLAVLENSAEDTKKYISDLKEILEVIKKNEQ